MADVAPEREREGERGKEREGRHREGIEREIRERQSWA